MVIVTIFFSRLNPSPCGFLPLGNPYLKILDFSQLFIADAPKKKIPKI